MGAAVVRHAEGARIGDAAAAYPIGRFDHDATSSCRHHAACRRDAGRACPDDHDVDDAR
jgi:hypothetical protein